MSVRKNGYLPTWNILHKFDIDTPGCFIAVIYKEKINCIIGRSEILFVNKDGIFTRNTKKLLLDMASPDETLAIYAKDNNKLIWIWIDHRAQIPTFNFSPPFYYGPSLIMAGELNLDTLEFKEHIIGYDKYDLKDLFGNNFESK